MMMNIKVLVLFLLMTLALSTVSYADSKSKERKIEWSEVPHQAQQTITEHIQGGEIFKIKKENIILMTEKKKENKTILYLVGVKKPDGKKIWITVDKSGELIDIEDEETEKVLEDEEDGKNKKNKKDN